MVRTHLRRSALSGAAFLAGVSLAAMSAAHAQQAGDEAVDLDSISVTGDGETGDGPVKGYVARRSLSATKTDTPIEKTPQSIAVVPRQQMDDQQVQSAAEALRYTPGVFAEYRGASNLRDETFVRGFFYTPRYLDGMLLGGELSYAKVYPQLLERVELLSGPSSILYGQMSPGGIINMVSKKPTEDPLHEVEFLFGSRNHLETSFDFSDKAPGSDTVAWRITGVGLGTDLQEDYAKQKAFAIGPSVSWTPNDSTKITVIGGYQNEPEAGFRNFLDAAGTLTDLGNVGRVPRKFFVSDPDYEKLEREQAWIGYELEHAFNDAVTVRQKMRYHWVDWTHHSLVWGSSTVDPGTGDVSVSRGASGGTESWKTFTADNQLQAKLETGPAEHTVLTGVDYRHRVRDYVWGYDWANVPSISLNNPRYGNWNVSAISLSDAYDSRTTAKQAGVYLQDQMEIGRLNILAGLRYDKAQTDINDRHLGSVDQSYDDHAVTWRLGALYAFDNGLAPYVSYSTSFDPALYAPQAGESPFKPTKGRQIEAGVKFAPEGSNLLLTAAAYDLRQKNIVDSEWVPEVGSVYKQIGEIHNQGVELSARARLFDRVNLIASYAYIDSEITDSIVGDEVGKTPARIPGHQAGLWATYDFTAGAINGLTVGGGVRYIGKSWGDDANSFRVPAYALFDAMAKYDFGAVSPKLKGVSLQVNAKNLADKTYVASCANAYACFYGEGRVVTAAMKLKW